MGVKKIIPHADEVSGDENHLKVMALAAEQLKLGHYRLENIEVDQSENDDGSQRFEITFDRVETDTNVTAEPHDLGELSEDE